MEDTAKKFSSILFDVLQEKGVKHVVCSPGSRNVPLLIAAASRPELKKHFVVDERSAAFLALGISLVSRQPVAILCTSGTALLNYAPAIAEAYYQAIPLLVISADRPVQWIDQDDSQTLRQDGALNNYVKKSYSLPADGEENPQLQWYVNRLANDAVITATSGRMGPVHINVHLDEPLGKKTEKNTSHQRIIHTLEADALANKEVFRQLADSIKNKRILLVCGFSQPDSRLQKAIADFSTFPNVVCMAETISNLHLNLKDFNIDSVITAYDEEVLDSYRPDVVISIGGALVSRKLKEFLRRNSQDCIHWSVGFSHTTSDPFMSLSLKIETEPARFFKNLNNALKKYRASSQMPDYRKEWLHLRQRASEVKNRFIDSAPWSELKAFDFILRNLPRDYNLFLSNGTAIRYAQIIEYDLPHASYCNRGVSGIDGSISTAIGGALAYKGRSIIITGDLSMAYDISSLSLRDVPDDFKIIVIDNQGGGIFRFIPSTSTLKECEEYLCQPPLLPLRNLAEGYGWAYMECDNLGTLDKIYPSFLSLKEKAILNISCNGELSASILKQYMDIKI
ncbi:MAG: 2-succinyl-5-enolpyruvyl-6-hydroxy-3-cyclohexene-1-carboxylic-acid synthase [Muribaculaceae bacterium]|nr:2-succinyl-5-enolpyruvyl-6-hydroxy-3-cyclohexene-1-carboxylic-acid synthase [Muribaculaceae bacterium]